MKPTDVLREEHGGVKVMLRITDAVLALPDPGVKGRRDLGNILEFFRIFVDRCHHTKEEELLFPALRGRPGTGELVEELLQDHERGRKLVEKMEFSLNEWEKGSDGAREEFVRAWTAYRNLLGEHIRREDEDLWESAEATLSDTVKSSLVSGFEKVEVERIGAGKHEEFHELIHHLRDTYLIPRRISLDFLREYRDERFTPKGLYESHLGKVLVAFFREGQFIPPHSPSVDLVLLVLEGEGEVTGGGETFPVSPGDIVIVPAHVKRGVRARTEMTVLHAVFPPPSTEDHREVEEAFKRG